LNLLSKSENERKYVYKKLALMMIMNITIESSRLIIKSSRQVINITKGKGISTIILH